MISSKRGSPRNGANHGAVDAARAILVSILLAGCTGHTVPSYTVQPRPAIGPETATWRVVSYNIRHGRGMDDVVDLERTADVLRRLDPDIVALQEVDNVVERSGGVDQARRLGELLGMHHAFGSFMDYQGGQYGMAFLSRCTILRSEAVRLTDGNEPRVALVIEVAQPDGSVLTAVNVHFDWVRDDGFRFAQASEVARYLDALPGPWVLAGDFNDMPGSRTLELFDGHAMAATKPGGRQFTFPSGTPAREIDFVFVSSAHGWSVTNVDVVAETMASDHRPVVADLEIRPAAASAAHAAQPCVRAA